MILLLEPTCSIGTNQSQQLSCDLPTNLERTFAEASTSATGRDPQADQVVGDWRAGMMLSRSQPFLPATSGNQGPFLPANSGNQGPSQSSWSPRVYKPVSDVGSDEQPQLLAFPLSCKRTVLLAHLPHGVAYWELSRAISGGNLVDLSINEDDRTAQVSFLLEENAREFYEFSKQVDVLIKGKRVRNSPTLF